jgi:hypothetical protein
MLLIVRNSIAVFSTALCNAARGGPPAEDSKG